jgi:prolyl 4-hydroxylase
VWTAGQETLNTKVRHSEKAPLPRDQTVKCIEERARTFQGWRPYVFVEKLWAQRYTSGGHYTYHYDWSTATQKSGRISSFMVYLEANCTGGGTHFPRLQRPAGNEWCKFIECDAGEDELKEGVIFKPVAGNAVYWENMRSDGSGYPESWHAGLPVESGSKIGLNIWSWLQVGYEPPREKE